jgi:outer membrane protein, multidrug efflux system
MTGCGKHPDQEAQKIAVQAANDRYRASLARYYEVLEAQPQLFPAENNLSEIEASQQLVTAQLYKALGGGWSLDDKRWIATQSLR